MKRVVEYNEFFDKRYDIGMNYQDKGIVFHEHYHDYIELVCQVEGSSIHYVDGKKIKITANEMLIIRTDQKHLNMPCNYDVINIIVPKQYLDTIQYESSFDGDILRLKNFILYAENKYTFKLNIESITLLKRIDEFEKEKKQTAMYHFKQKLFIVQFLLSLEALIPVDITVDTSLLDVMTYIHSDIRNASLNEYSRMCNYSPSSMSQKIKKEYQMSFLEIVKNLKMRKSAALLASTAKSIETIIDEVGYNNKTHFYKLFKKEYQMTPQEYRVKYNANY